ncbi:MAG TPA: RodZ domain-containing protein [Burkholderiales bacterium]|nr:RodZ domain-containing protein [Burkholderiales bacterium]
MSGPAADASASAPAPGAGAKLLAERRRQGLSLGDISRQLKLSVRQVEALERDDYSGYGNAVFIHGFIRNYAKLLGLDPEPLIREADSLLAPPPAEPAPARPPERPAPVESEAPESKPAGRRAGVMIAVTVAIIVAVAFGMMKRTPVAGKGDAAVAQRGAEPARADDAPRETPAKAVPETRPESRPAAGRPRAAARPDEPKPAEPRAAETKATETKAAETTPQSGDEATRHEAPQAQDGETPPAAGGAERITLRMVFEQESWVEIKDRSGTTVFGQLNPAGSTRRASGEPPLSVVVGNAAGVRIYRGDEMVDLAPHTRVDVARLTIE